MAITIVTLINTYQKSISSSKVFYTLPATSESQPNHNCCEIIGSKLLRIISMTQQAQTSSSSSATDSVGVSSRSSDPQKILFLDVDGVLHSTPHNFGEEFREECTNQLKHIINQTNASIVISSGWRNHDWSMKQLDEALEGMGLTYIGKTPNYSGKSVTSNITRRKEILAWLDQHPEIQQWVAIDDLNLADGYKDLVVDSLEVKRMQGHFVRTDKLIGLNKETAEVAIRMLSDNTSKDDDESDTEQDMEVDSNENC
eukprot:TRINITY_DN4256_c0_g1_i3.p2 TRINITY_DN4256_c0_g1~~TRINITY_DN4256_c0_g1_i3.p2  ORF type:complete len:256 (-),score=20.28 TRINITY_DN4256_c0_g1_i3:869-1636(-)